MVCAGRAAADVASRAFWGIVSPQAVGARHALALAASIMRQVLPSYLIFPCSPVVSPGVRETCPSRASHRISQTSQDMAVARA